MRLATKALALVSACLLTLSGACSAVNDEGTGTTSPAPSSGIQSPPRAEADPSTSPNGSNEFQVMSGLGVNANVHSWNDGELRPAIDQIAELGDVTWRVIIDKADWEVEENPDSTDLIDWEYYTRIYEGGKMADLWDTVEYINSKPGQEVMVNVMGGVPEWMGGTRIEESKEDHWVRMIASMVAYGRSVRGVDFTLLGPMNETDWNGIEGPRVGPEQYVRLLHKLILRLDEMDLTDIRIVGPDTASASTAVQEYLPELEKDSLVMSRLAHFAIHSYDGGAAGTAEAIRELTNTSASELPLDFWVTEFAGPCPGCDSGSPNPTNWISASSTAAQAISLLEQGTAGLQQYDAWDGYYEHHESMGYWGLLLYDATTGKYHPRKTYFVVRQLIEYVPRNAVRIAVSSDQPEVHVVAFQDKASGRITFFGYNASAQEAYVTMQLTGLRESLQLSSYVTDGNRNMEGREQEKLAGGVATYKCAPDSVFTLTGIPTKG